MRGGHRGGTPVVVARPVVRALAAGLVASSLGALPVLGLTIALVHGSRNVPVGVWVVLAVVTLGQFVAGACGVVAYGWSR